jgi:transmembrane sensor
MNDNLPSAHIGDAARLWALRASDPAFGDWDGLTDWLETDPAHLAAYDDALAQDDWLGEVFAAQPPEAPGVPQPQAMPETPARHRAGWRYGWGAGIAAAVAAVVSFTVLDRGGPMQEIATPPGEQRTIALADGSRVILNGSTRIAFAADRPREITLTEGEALFDVRHDDDNPFVVMAGETRLLDAGTVFNVVREGGMLDVAVAEGEVIYEPGSQEIRLNAGDGLSRAGADALPVLRKASPAAIGGWRGGRLEYGNAPLADVARDLGRNLGVSIRVADGAGAARFTGTLAVDGPAEDVLARAGPLLGVRFAAGPDGWRMIPADGTRP